MKKRILIVITILLIIMLIPMKNRLKDGGSIQYKAILYDITKVHRLNENSSTGYDDGLIVKVFGIQVYNVINTYVEVNDKISMEELKIMQDEIGDNLKKYREHNVYDNFSSCFVDEEKNRIVVELINDSQEEQSWFRRNIYDSEYIVFKRGGPYYTQ